MCIRDSLPPRPHPRKNFCSGDVACPRRCPEGRDGAVFPAWARKGTREEKLEGRSMVSGFFRGGHRERARPDVSIHSRPIRRLSFSRCDAGSTDKDSNVLRGKTAHESAVAIRKPAGAGNGYRLRSRRTGVVLTVSLGERSQTTKEILIKKAGCLPRNGLEGEDAGQKLETAKRGPQRSLHLLSATGHEKRAPEGALFVFDGEGVIFSALLRWPAASRARSSDP